MNPHDFDCNTRRFGSAIGAGDCNCSRRFQASDEALAELRRKLTGEKLDSTPISLTVYTNAGEVTVVVREDSIEMRGNNLIAEGATDNATLNDLYTFVNVIGYMTRPI